MSGLEHHDVVFELHDHRIVAAGSGGEPVKAVAKLFGSDRQSRLAGRHLARRPQRRRRRHGRPPVPGAGTSVATSAGFAFAAVTSTSKNGHPPRVCTIFDRRHRAAEILPARVGGDDVHVAHDVVAQPGLDAIDDVVLIHVAVDDVVLAGRRLDRRAPGQDGVVLAVDLAAARGRVVLGRTFQETPGRDVELQRVGPGLRDIRLLRRDLLEERSGHQASLRRHAAGLFVAPV